MRNKTVHQCWKRFSSPIIFLIFCLCFSINEGGSWVSTFKSRSSKKSHTSHQSRQRLSFIRIAMGPTTSYASPDYDTRTKAVDSSESVTPTFYEDDLYGVLGVNYTATRKELKDAYWNIAFSTHPDRNNTPEALSLFRNASYAYKILGRDEGTRAEYDNKLKTIRYIDAVDQFSREVIAPFATEIAIPLIKLTVKGVASLTAPIVNDVKEQTTAVYQAAIDDKEEGKGDIFSRMFSAFLKTSSKQRARRARESIADLTLQFEYVNNQKLKLEVELKPQLEELDTLELYVLTANQSLQALSKYAYILYYCNVCE